MATIPKESAKFVFEGKVVNTKGGNVKAAAGAGRTILVSVERVVKAPEALAAYAGQDVTVRLAEDETVKKGQRATFYTNGWIFGENLAVQSLGHEPVQAAPTTAAAAGLEGQPDPARAAAHDRIRERASEAPVVITGKVVAIGLPAEPVTAAAGTAPTERVSEHEPFWREAIVEVKEVLKGSVGQSQVVLRFPSSTDVRWHRAPKFEAGQEGVFSLHPDAVSRQVSRGPAAASLGATDTFTCLHRADFQPSHNQAEAAVAIDAAKK
jgi:hypothetical protein